MAGSSRSRAVAVATAAALVVAFSPSAGAAPRALSGKLSKKGYTVIALATNGRARTTVARPRFKLVPPGSRVTLHLRGRDGHYAGPVVVGRAGKRSIVGVKAGAKLGRVRVRNGYATAKVAKR